MLSWICLDCSGGYDMSVLCFTLQEAEHQFDHSLYPQQQVQKFPCHLDTHLK